MYRKLNFAFIFIFFIFSLQIILSYRNKKIHKNYEKSIEMRKNICNMQFKTTNHLYK